RRTSAWPEDRRSGGPQSRPNAPQRRSTSPRRYPPCVTEDEAMEIALQEARLALARDDLPVGAAALGVGRVATRRHSEGEKGGDERRASERVRGVARKLLRGAASESKRGVAERA